MEFVEDRGLFLAGKTKGIEDFDHHDIGGDVSERKPFLRSEAQIGDIRGTGRPCELERGKHLANLDGAHCDRRIRPGWA